MIFSEVLPLTKTIYMCICTSFCTRKKRGCIFTILVTKVYDGVMRVVGHGPERAQSGSMLRDFLPYGGVQVPEGTVIILCVCVCVCVCVSV